MHIDNLEALNTIISILNVGNVRKALLPPHSIQTTAVLPPHSNATQEEGLASLPPQCF